jgi:hypothetical protein
VLLGPNASVSHGSVLKIIEHATSHQGLQNPRCKVLETHSRDYTF